MCKVDPPDEGGGRYSKGPATAKRVLFDFPAGGKQNHAVRYTAQSLLVPSRLKADGFGVVNRVTAPEAGWSLLGAETRRLREGETFEQDTTAHELCLVVLGGRAAVTSNRGEWPTLGRRENVFEGLPWALYLPPQTQFRVRALGGPLEFAHAWAPSDQSHPPRLVTPDEVRIELRGGRNATRQINSILPPGSPCHRLVAVEVFTPGGNWSSYPPHKHDRHLPAADGSLQEADLEELYLYKLRRPEGWALQRVYTDDRSIDATVTARDGDIVLVPEGYHPVSAAYGYDCYYLNFLAGSAQSLACVDDPAHAWVKQTWDEQDPRIPMVTREMER
jgi:5-deoxy-glucuronate isomerase